MSIYWEDSWRFTRLWVYQFEDHPSSSANPGDAGSANANPPFFANSTYIKKHTSVIFWWFVGPLLKNKNHKLCIWVYGYISILSSVSRSSWWGGLPSGGESLCSPSPWVRHFGGDLQCTCHASGTCFWEMDKNKDTQRPTALVVFLSKIKHQVAVFCWPGFDDLTNRIKF